MCGIFGWSSSKMSEDSYSIFSNTLIHRGPDNTGIYNDQNITLGHTRLAIIESTSLGDQPMYDSTENFIIVFNGEIYNYVSIRNELKNIGFRFKSNSDTEVILNSYIAWGESCLCKFRGMFAFVIYDKIKSSFFIARDRFGIKPIYLYLQGNDFIFSSEIRPFFNIDFVNKNININSIYNLFEMGCSIQPQTIINDVFLLEPGHFMKIDINLNFEKKEYYNLLDHQESELNLSYHELKYKLRAILEEATKFHLISDVEIGAFLSGGIDSSAVVGLMQKISNKQIKTYCVGFQNSNLNDETIFATETAKIYNTKHTNIFIDDIYISTIFDDFINSIDQPSSDGINTYIVSRESSKDIKVSLSGLGGDEIFHGYSLYNNIFNTQLKKSTFFNKIGKSIEFKFSNRFTRDCILYDLTPENALSLIRSNRNAKDYFNFKNNNFSNSKESNILSFCQKIFNAEIKNYLLNTLLLDCDIYSMANSIEVRPLLLDHKIVEFAFNIPDQFKLNNFSNKKILTDALFDIIPNEVINRKKRGFNMPYIHWMNGILNERFNEVLNNNYTINNIFNKKFINDLKYRVRNKKTINSDWIALVLFEWIKKRNISL
jgi:asparagine synthase (glutamine-hydrolysing)